MKTQAQLLTLINETISALPYPAVAPELFEPIRYVLSLGGKRIRPVLALMGASLFNDEVLPALKPALGIEVFHNFTLLHDDLMDKAVVRRNKPTVHIKWDDNTAILSGDAMQIMAYQLITETPAAHLAEVLTLFSQTALEICEGQQFDMEFEKREDVKEEEYLEMIRLKTAVLLGCALKTGAIIAGASEKDASLLYEFGENIGLAFQLKDDLLDVYGDPKLFGKNIGGDICNNKKTFLLINALNLASEEEKEIMNGQMNLPEFNREAKIALFTDIFTRTGAKNLCEAKMADYFNRGMQALEKVSVSVERKSQLKSLAEDLMHRES
ncbi:MAG: polyprenyl synthetase family protein [Bacteroidales bacterium]